MITLHEGVMALKTGFVGAGKVGFTLGKYFTTHGARVTGYYSRNTDSADDAAQFTHSKSYRELGDLAADSDVLFLTVPDSSIAAVAAAICEYPIQGKIICHCSGALSAEAAMPGAEQFGACVYSVHPLFAVSDRYAAYRELSDVFFALEGSAERLDTVDTWLKGLGLSVQIIDGASKARYHCAAAMASNLAVGLVAQSVEMLKTCGFSRERAQQALKPLVLGNAAHIAEAGPLGALTGPVERGDTKTVAAHLDCFDKANDRLLYALLSQKLLALAKIKHPDRPYQSLENLLLSLGETTQNEKHG